MRNSLKALNPRTVFSRSPAHRIHPKAPAGLRSVSGSNHPQRTDSNKDPKPKSRETTPGGGYATRSDEQGYGAMYKGNPSISNSDEDKILHGPPEYDEREEVPVVKKERS